MKRYNVTITQNNIGVRTITVYSSTKHGACIKAKRLFFSDWSKEEKNKYAKTITAVAKHSDFYGNELPENITGYNYSIPYITI
jgi:hypothetical protein